MSDTWKEEERLLKILIPASIIVGTILGIFLYYLWK